MSNFDAARAATYDQGAQAAIIGHDSLYEVVMTMLNGHPMERVLILGAGTGTETILFKKGFPHVQVVAIDPSEPMLEVARGKLAAQGLEVDLRCGVLEQFDDLTDLDAVVMIGVLHHLSGPEEQERLLEQLGQRLKTGGLLLSGSQVGPMSDPLRARAWEQRWRDFGATDDEVRQRREKVKEIHALDLERFLGWLEQSGFRHSERVFSSLFFEVWACLRGSSGEK